jgi:hypothetical protein
MCRRMPEKGSIAVWVWGWSQGPERSCWPSQEGLPRGAGALGGIPLARTVGGGTSDPKGKYMCMFFPLLIFPLDWVLGYYIHAPVVAFIGCSCIIIFASISFFFSIVGFARFFW